MPWWNTSRTLPSVGYFHSPFRHCWLWRNHLPACDVMPSWLAAGDDGKWRLAWHYRHHRHLMLMVAWLPHKGCSLFAIRTRFVLMMQRLMLVCADLLLQYSRFVLLSPAWFSCTNKDRKVKQAALFWLLWPPFSALLLVSLLKHSGVGKYTGFAITCDGCSFGVLDINHRLTSAVWWCGFAV